MPEKFTLGLPIFVTAALLGLCACQRREHRPADEATPQERQQVEAELTRLEALAREAGQERNFHEIPVLVTTAGSTDKEPFSGECVRPASGKGRYIRLDRSVFARPSESGTASQLFTTLAHEIGHCYFNRDHESSWLSQSGYFLVWRGDDGRHHALRSIPSSLMTPESASNMVPKALESYYLREIVGGPRATQVSDLRGFGFSFDLVSETTRVCSSPNECKPLNQM